MKYISLLATGSVLLPKSLKRFQEASFRELRNGVGIFSMQGGTIGWFTSEDGIIVIDSQFPNPARAFLDGISTIGVGPDKVLFNTHHHGDHVGGNLVFQQNDYQIIAHENVPGLQRQSAVASDNEANQAYADQTFTDEFSLDLGTEKVMAKYYGPAHTKGDSVIWFENANIAHMGDLQFNRLYPFIDRNGGASIKGWISLMESVYSEADSDTIFIFGHGNPEFGVTGSKEDLLVKRNFLSHLLEYTEKAIQAGGTREEITQKEQFDEFPDFISPNNFLSLPRNLDVAYLELTEISSDS